MSSSSRQLVEESHRFRILSKRAVAGFRVRENLGTIKSPDALKRHFPHFEWCFFISFILTENNNYFLRKRPL